MTDDRENIIDDVTDGWPDEPSNNELADFARQLRRNRPQLSEEALGRIRVSMRQAAQTASRGSRNWRGFWKPALAASVLLAAGVWAWQRHSHKTGELASGPQAAAPLVHDSYAVSSDALPPPSVPSEPLLRLGDYVALTGQNR